MRDQRTVIASPAYGDCMRFQHTVIVCESNIRWLDVSLIKKGGMRAQHAVIACESWCCDRIRVIRECMSWKEELHCDSWIDQCQCFITDFWKTARDSERQTDWQVIRIFDLHVNRQMIQTFYHLDVNITMHANYFACEFKYLLHMHQSTGEVRWCIDEFKSYIPQS